MPTFKRHQRLTHEMAVALAAVIASSLTYENFAYFIEVRGERTDVSGSVYELAELNYLVFQRNRTVAITRSGKLALTHWENLRLSTQGRIPPVD